MFGAMLLEAWAAIGANRLRSLLTMLGMVIGVAAVILMLALGRGAQFTVEQGIASMGSNLFMILSGAPTQGGVRGGTGGAPTLTLADNDAILDTPGNYHQRPTLHGQQPAGIWCQQLVNPGVWYYAVLSGCPQLEPV
ncbi:ABC transporter permease [Paludibacterium denitrificans]|uniref:ABC transporter permease n=1 Tax=Paludibacterium denitrificans TaxID=2675226 RepID=UPI002477FAB7|nr:ABC transporter permease [Paludibacterium denitrificans]